MAEEVVLYLVLVVFLLIGSSLSWEVELIGGGKDKCIGTLALKADGLYGVICDMNIGAREAAVICREKGYDTIEARRIHGPPLFNVSDPESMTLLPLSWACNGTEGSLSQCDKAGTMCANSNDIVAINCCKSESGGAGTYVYREEEEVKLVGGYNQCQGFLLTKTNGRFGLAHNLITGDNEAQVVCRMIQGCSPHGARRVDSSQFDVIKLNVQHVLGKQCNGSESNLNECTVKFGAIFSQRRRFAYPIAFSCGGFGTPILEERHDIGIGSCKGKDCKDVILAGGNDECQGLLLLYNRDHRGYGLACNWMASHREAEVACQMNGCEPEGARRVDPYQFGFTEYIKKYYNFLTVCNGSEKHLRDCAHGPSICMYPKASSGIAISCGDSDDAEDLGARVGIDCRGRECKEMILAGGKTERQGILMLLHREDFIYYAASNWMFSHNEAGVICRELGLETKQAKRVDPLQFSWHESIQYFLKIGGKCNGDEMSLEECEAGAGPIATYYPRPIDVVAISCEDNDNMVTVKDHYGVEIGSCRGSQCPNMTLVGGENRCEGMLAFHTRYYDEYALASCNSLMAEAKAVCGYLNCHMNNPQRVNASIFGFALDMHISVFQCKEKVGNRREWLYSRCNVSDFDKEGVICKWETSNIIAIKCDEESSGKAIRTPIEFLSKDDFYHPFCEDEDTHCSNVFTAF